MSDPKKILQMIKDNDIKYVDFRFTDPKGKWHHVAQHIVTVDEDMLKSLMAEIDEGVEVLVGLQPHAAAVATIATVRAAQRNEFFAPETDAAVAAVSGGDIDFGFVDEFHGFGDE